MLQPAVSQSSKVEGVIRLTTGGRIDLWTLNNPRAGRSRRYRLVIFDEAAFAEDGTEETWERSIEPTLLDYQGKAIFASNAKALDESNWFYKLHQACGGRGGAEFPEKKKPGFLEFHAPTRNNPHVPERLEGETEESHARRRLEVLEQIKASKHPLQWQAEYEAEFIDFRGVAFFDLQKMLVDGQPIEYPTHCDSVFATVDTATKTGKTNDGTAVCYWAWTLPNFGPYQLVLLDWDIVQVEGALLDVWLKGVFTNLETYAKRCQARGGSIGALIEDKSSGMVLLQQALRHGWPAHPIDSKLTVMGKSERALSVASYVYQGLVKLSRHAHEKVVTYKNDTRNHFLSQFLGFRVGDEDKNRADDLLDTGTYAISVALGNQEGW